MAFSPSAIDSCYRDGVTFLDLEVTSDASVAALVQQVIDRFGRIDALVDNAGIGSPGATEESSLAQHQHVFDINVFGVIRMTKAVLPHMRAQGRGRIINLSSIYGFMPQPFMSAYNLVQPDTPLPVYAEQRRIVDRAVAETVTGGDAHAVVA